MLIARVFTEATTIQFDKPFDYLVPSDKADIIKIGQRVTVPFGRANKKRIAVVYDVLPLDSASVAKLKPISSIIDKTPLITDEMLKMAEYISNHTFCTFYDAIRPMLPVGINVNIVSTYFAKDVLPCDYSFSDDEIRIINCIKNSKDGVRKDRIFEIFGLDSNSKILDGLVDKGAIFSSDEAIRKVGDATVKMVRLSASDKNNDASPIKLTVKQQAVIDFLEQSQTASVKEVCYFAGVTNAVVMNLFKKNIVDIYEVEVYRSPYQSTSNGNRTAIDLSDEQQAAYSGLLQINKECQINKKGKSALLYGVTGSGKTQVFLSLIDNVVDSGKGVILMVPEIALTPQAMSIFQSRYGKLVAIFHSAMSLGQRTDEWKRVKRGEAKIAIGTRSAVFAPFDDLGLIIMDEEQEHTYKSESTPRFSAKDVAKFRSAYNNCLFLMASATPSIETYSYAKEGKIPMFTMTKRFGNVHLPKVRTVNMKEQYKMGNFGILSDELCKSLSDVFHSKKQSILLLNRRGYNVFISCRGCGNVKLCPNCSISLTYHTANNRLMCHYCGYSEDFNDKCSECGDKRVKLSGYGTQKVEEELSTIFPSARILRMDADTTMARFSHEKKLTAFANGEYDIMVGTQMVAKGLDFPNVTLVGVINADQSLYSGDFKSAERTFSLLTQVIGRSGRGEAEGEAIIQTISPENEIIWQSAKQDYDLFYETEVLARKLITYPPYCNLCMVGFIGENRDLTEECARYYFDLLTKRLKSDYSDLKVIILGPSVAQVPKISNKYRYRMIIKCKNSVRFRLLIRELLVTVMGISKYKSISVFADMDPENTL